MAWTSGCSGSTNEELVNNLHHAGFITRDDILHAMLNTDRNKYVPELNSSQCVSSTYKYGPYADAPQSIGSKVTISAPYIHAIELDVLADQIVKTGSRVLDIGCGSGILLAYMMRMAVSKSIIVGLEIVEDLVNLSRMNLISDGFHLSSTLQYDDSSSEFSDHHQLIIRQGNGWHGAIDLGPFDAINVGAAAASVPLELIHQLRFNGTLLIPIGNQVQGTQILTKYIKRRKHIVTNDDDNNNNVDVIDNGMCMNGEDWVLESIPLKPVRFVPLVQCDTTTTIACTATAIAPDINASTPITTTIDWNRRYKKGWAYGKQPNEFLVHCVDTYCNYFHDHDHLPSHDDHLPSHDNHPSHDDHHLPSHDHHHTLHALSLGEGQGRNAVYLATKGYHCTAVDHSKVGLSKVKDLATARGVLDSITIEHEDLCQYYPTSNHYDLIISIFCILKPGDRQALHRRCIEALRPGGLLIFLCFSSRQEELRCSSSNSSSITSPTSTSYWNLGPSTDCLVSCQQLADDFEGLEIIHAEECTKMLNEGKYHRGKAILTEFVARKRINVNNIMYRSMMDLLFYDAEKQWGTNKIQMVEGIEDDNHGNDDADESDQLLRHAHYMFKVSCMEALRSKWCRYCWNPYHLCYCRAIQDQVYRSIRQSFDHFKDSTIHLHWVIVIHPNEFLRSTSSMKIAMLYLSQAFGNSCEMLVYGCCIHRDRLHEILINANHTPTCILFPGHDEESNNHNASHHTHDINSLNSNESNESGGKNEDNSYVNIDPSTIQTSGNNKAKSVDEVMKDVISHPHRQSHDCNSNSNRSSSRPTLTIIVPDGPWDGARAMVEAFMRGVSPNKSILPLMQLDETIVANTFSPLIDALKAGQGKGRISTLEACGILLQQIGHVEAAQCLLDCLQPLVESIYQSAPSCSKVIATGECNRSVNHVQRYNQMLHCLLEVVKQITPIPVPVGLRRCILCGENLATASRMQQHLRGKKHCMAVIESYLRDGGVVAIENTMVDASMLRSIYDQYSTHLLSQCQPEPPDIALALLKSSLALKQGINGSSSKGERSILTINSPHVTSELPLALRVQCEIRFDTNAYNLYDAVVILLQRMPTIGYFRSSVSKSSEIVVVIDSKNKLEDFIVTSGVFRNFKSRQILYNAVNNDSYFLSIYENLIMDICCPYLKARFIELEQDIKEEEKEGSKKKLRLYYQYPPTLRLQSGPSEEHGRTHRDMEYGHQVGEINFWMPLTDYHVTQTTLWVESKPDCNDFQPLNINYGIIAMFHGSLCRHYAPINKSEYTRVSLDFRIGIGEYFDPKWVLKDVRGKHGRREVDI